MREFILALLKRVPWDGYLKYYRPSPKITNKKYDSLGAFQDPGSIYRPVAVCELKVINVDSSI